ncbi:MAG: RNA recognition motif domain-containing protein [Bacteroidia bacterium]
MNLFVARLSYTTTNDGLQQAFEPFGEVSSARVIMDRDTGKSKGFGFVEMPDDEAAQNAINELNESDLDGRTIVVKEANDNGGGNRGGGGGRSFGNRGGGGRDNYSRRDGGGSRDGGYERRRSY